MNCPKCGYERQSRDDAFVPPRECPACGVVYAKHDPANESTEAVRPTLAPHLRPSPVDALSLRKARERVEKRLREQLGNRIQDDRHSRTLELAKQLTSEELRKRQDQWKKTHVSAEEEATSDTDGESQTLTPGAEPSPADEDSQDRNQSTDQAADEIMTAAAAEETADLPEPVVEDPAEPVDDGDAVAASDSLEDLEYGPSDATEIGPTEISVEETPPMDPGTAAPESPDAMPAAHVIAMALPQTPKSGWGVGLTRLLPVVAWLILGAGITGAILSWTTIGEVETGARIPIPEGLHSFPLGLLLGFAYLATGVLGFAFFWVSSLISTQLRDIYHLLLPADRDGNTLQDEAA